MDAAFFCSEKKLSLVRYFHADFTYLKMRSPCLILVGNATSPIVKSKIPIGEYFKDVAIDST